jgi:fermentation-respiration switch protein FrsA (DUF1100 family)
LKIARVTVAQVWRVPSYAAWPILAAFTYGCLYFFANRAIYYPSKYPEGSWEMQRLLGPALDVWMETRDGVRLNAWWVPCEGARFVTLYLHGNAGNVTDRIPHIREIVAAGSSILVLDYRGYGKSGGRPGENGLYMDSQAAFAHLLKMGYRADQVIVHGESLGTAVAVDLASRQSCAAVILEAPFTSASDVAGTVLPVLGPLLVRSYNSLSKIHAVLAPKLFLEGDRDEIIPPRLAQALYEAAPGPKEYWVVEGAGHNDIVETAGTRYRERLQKFYREIGRE